MFGYTIVRKDYLERLERNHTKLRKLVYVTSWFSGWRDLKIIWDYVFTETYYGGIESCRREYAKSRGTDEYGSPRKCEINIPKVIPAELDGLPED
jgi:hypothetical protein